MKMKKSQALRLIVHDFFALWKVSGFSTAVKWVWSIAVNFRECNRIHSLGPADAAMGAGPFPAQRGNARAVIKGVDGISGIREIWCRDVYLANDFVQIPDNGLVVDLGANMGNFTVLALSHGSGVKVIAVEIQPECIEKLKENVAANGWLDRVHICPGLIGGVTAVHDGITASLAAKGYFPRVISEDEFIQDNQLTRIDFLKCDIEGSEFELLKPGSKLLSMSEQLGIEIHGWAGDLDEFEEMLKTEGFDIVRTHDYFGDAINRDRVVVARRKSIESR